MSSTIIKVLLVEDNARDAYLLQNFLSSVAHIELTYVERLDEAICCLDETQFDAILLDLSLPDSHGLNTIRQIHAANPERPIVVLTELDDEDLAITALREGAQDYLVKDDIQKTWLVRAIHYAIERQQNLDQLQQLTDQLQQLNQELIRSNQELEQFAHMVSHDLQQSLQAIEGFANILDLIYRDRSEESVNQYIADIVQAVRRMSQLICPASL